MKDGSVRRSIQEQGGGAVVAGASVAAGGVAAGGVAGAVSAARRDMVVKVAASATLATATTNLSFFIDLLVDGSAFR